MINPTATSPVADDVMRVAAIGVAGSRAMFATSASHLPMLRGPMVAYAPEDDAGAAAPDGGGEAEEIDEDRAPAPDGDDDAPQGGEEGDPGTGDADNPDAETAEIEHDGKTFKVPAALKDSFLRQADYTQKTQTLADDRRALESERTAWQSQQAQEREALAGLQEDYGKVHSLKAQVAAFAEINWAKAYEEAGLSENPAQALAQVNAAKAKMDGLQAELAEAEKTLKTKTDTFEQTQRDNRAKAMQEVGRVLAEKIPGFNREKAGQLVELATSRGVTVEEMQAADDPRSWLLLHDLHEAKATIASLQAQLAGKTKVQEQERAGAAKPATSVSGRSTPPTGPDDRNSTENWMKRREAQLAAKRQAGAGR